MWRLSANKLLSLSDKYINLEREQGRELVPKEKNLNLHHLYME